MFREGGIPAEKVARPKIFDMPYVDSYVSHFVTLLPGDLISIGTPHGVGLGMKPPQYLKAGDVVELGIDGLGQSRQQVFAWEPAIGNICFASCRPPIARGGRALKPGLHNQIN